MLLMSQAMAHSLRIWKQPRGQEESAASSSPQHCLQAERVERRSGQAASLRSGQKASQQLPLAAQVQQSQARSVLSASSQHTLILILLRCDPQQGTGWIAAKQPPLGAAAASERRVKQKAPARLQQALSPQMQLRRACSSSRLQLLPSESPQHSSCQPPGTGWISNCCCCCADSDRCLRCRCRCSTPLGSLPGTDWIAAGSQWIRWRSTLWLTWQQRWKLHLDSRALLTASEERKRPAACLSPLSLPRLAFPATVARGIHGRQRQVAVGWRTSLLLFGGVPVDDGEATRTTGRRRAESHGTER